jgi:hypothetical protein
MSKPLIVAAEDDLKRHGLDGHSARAFVQVFYLPVFGFRASFPSRFNSAIATP